ncbi:hypothetical protein DPMN_144046 [Dreissena polymorpha]|uniref:Uncharacterized protein n=1 Tax=Dreissena polymorpha TaxID=45954 RepID=A0A9D4GHF8_DREPO|nr:hypothetical protein DPMN_144046 [Dreissena polymorpha]
MLTVLKLPALAEDALIDEAVERTIKVQGQRGCSMMGVLNILTTNGILDKDLETFRHTQCNKNQQDSIPHILAVGCGTQALNTIKGRQPLCLYCQEVGHATASAQAFTPAQKQAEEQPPSQEDETGFKTNTETLEEHQHLWVMGQIGSRKLQHTGSSPIEDIQRYHIARDTLSCARPARSGR